MKNGNIALLIGKSRCFALRLTFSTGILIATFLSLSAVPATGTGQTVSETSIGNVVSGFRTRSIGPAASGGRVSALAVQKDLPSVFYVGTATGGVWKTINGGTTFKPIFDNEPNLSIGAVAVSDSNPSIVWVGTGEANNRQSSSWGDGVYKSMDGGATWNRVGLKDTQSIGRIAIDPRNADVVYVAAAGHLWGPNAQRGLFKTNDGGRTWSKVLFIDNDTGIIDIALDPQSPNILYAAAYERRRTAWGFDGGGPGSALYESTDSGETWKKAANGFPTPGNLGRIGISICVGHPNIVYAVVESRKNGGVFRSEDRGKTWKRMNSNNLGAAYFSQIAVDPNNDLRIWVMLDELLLSQDGGVKFQPRDIDVHADFHALWIDPSDSAHIIAGNDGGVWTTRDMGRNWRFINNLPIGQVYRLGYDLENPYRICAGFQDNGALCGPSRNRSAGGISNRDWHGIHNADGFYALIDPKNPNIVYTDAQEGQLVRFNRLTHEWAPIQPIPNFNQPQYRFTWDAPLEISPHNPSTLFFGGNYLFKSIDRGDSWTELGGDLTTNVDRFKLPILGKLPSRDTVSLNYGVTFYPSITQVSQSPVDANVLWVGTEDGNLQVSRNGGKSWGNVADNVPGLPKGTWVTGIEPSHFSAGVVYATFDGHRSDDFHVYVYRTVDYGKTWRPISSNLTADDGTAHVIREDPYNPRLLFLGTEFGGFYSTDQGGHWNRLGAGVPDVRVDDLKIQPRAHDLLIGTYGRSIWILDDIRAWEELNGGQSTQITLFKPRPAIEWQKYIDNGNGFAGQGTFQAPNPPNAIFTYFLTTAPEKSKAVSITVKNQNGDIVRHLSGPANMGINRIPWDLRYDTPAKPWALQTWAIEQGFFVYRPQPIFGVPGPFVAPGQYSVEISSGGRTYSQTLSVENDPAIHIDPTSQAEYTELLMKSYHLFGQAVENQKTLIALSKSLGDALTSWKNSSTQNVPASLQKSAVSIEEKVHLIQMEVIGASSKAFPPPSRPLPLIWQIANLVYSLEAHTAKPTDMQQRQYSALDQALMQATVNLQRITTRDLPALNREINQAGVPLITVDSTATENGKDEKLH